MKSRLTFGILSTVAAFALTGCLVGQNEQYFEPVPSACNPFGDGISGLGKENGVRGKMFYLDDIDVQTKPHAVFADYKTHGHLARANFYFDNLYVPTRRFQDGFQLSNGKLLSKTDGTPLFEHFAFDFTTNIKLPAGSAARTMQFALLADDGANLLVQDPITGAWVNQVNDDGTHPARMVCGATPITITDKPTPLNIQYFQGPRYHISLVLMWRPWANRSNTTYCGSSDSNLFFDSSVSPSRATAAWLDNLTRWEVVPANMLYMDENDENPCNH